MIADVLQAAERRGPVKKAGKEYKAFCPVHGDKNESLDFHEENDGRVVVICRSHGCAFEDIAAAWGLPKSAFFPPKTAKPAGGARYTPFSYKDEQGAEVSQSVRVDPADGSKKTFFQRHRGPNGEWVNNTKGVRRVVYGLPELKAADPSEPVWVVGGEKCVHIMRDHGFVATTNIAGEGKWEVADSEFLRGRHVVVFPDCDEVGHKHGQQVAAALQGIAKSVKVVDVLGLPLKGDCEQYFSSGRTAQELRELAAKTPEWSPERARETDEPDTVCLATIEPRPVKYLWFGRLASGEMTVITGRPGVGKGLLLCYIVSRFTTGRPMHGDRVAQPSGTVLWVSVEDAHDTSLVPRLIAAGADRSRVHGWRMERGLSLPGDTDRIVAEMDRHRCGLLILDPAPTLLDKDHSSNNDAAVRQSFAALMAACRTRECCLLLVRHTNKRTIGDAIDRGGGSIGWTGQARVEMMLGRRPVEDGATVEDTHESVVTLATVKNNLGRWAKSLNLAIVEAGDSARIEVVGETETTADDLCAQEKPRTAHKTGEAEALLKHILADGKWHRSVEIEDAAKEAEISIATLKRAKKTLGVESTKRGDAWWCRLGQESQQGGTEILDTLDTDAACEPLLSHNNNYLENQECQGAQESHTHPSDTLAHSQPTRKVSL